MKREASELTTLISFTLCGGILVAVTVGVLGGLLYLSTSSNMQTASFHHFAGSDVPYSSLASVVHAAVTPGSLADRGMALSSMGVLVLMLTPIARVVLSLFVFLKAGDKLFALITLAVLGALSLSILLH